ncbi:hypothetical protein AA15669_1945 [Saccharibacter floricola DSM 15669]|uniref:Uncharacterized protein n=2 Tax=Saccharibacter TaxID=231052 RepID=A0ABQ0P167_9PROT|nr:hypothetical protein AA15669_1945 [Saccharibacter floricola DSM 15669]
MAKKSMQSILNVLSFRPSIGIKISALDYTNADLLMIANALSSESFLIITDASKMSASIALTSMLQRHKKNVIIDFT